MKKVILTGPESTGKTLLCQLISTAYDCPWVIEYARLYLAERNGIYEQEDLLKIALEQRKIQEMYERMDPDLLIFDTSNLVLKVWSEVKYGSCDNQIESMLLDEIDAFYLLCKPDIAWTADPLRENQFNRDDLFLKYHSFLLEKNLNFRIIDGKGDYRLQKAYSFVDDFLK